MTYTPTNRPAIGTRVTITTDGPAKGWEVTVTGWYPKFPWIVAIRTDGGTEASINVTEIA
jgi:hypothetical protein